jgi:hypothetical protein
MKRLLLVPLLAFVFGVAVGCDDKKDTPASTNTPGVGPNKGSGLPVPPTPPPKP